MSTQTTDYATFTPAQKEILAEAMILVDAFANDSAMVVIDQALAKMTDEEQTGVFALALRLRRAEVLEKDDQDTLAIQQLLEIVADSRLVESWETQANAHLSLARLQEKLGRMEAVAKQLEAVKVLIEQYSLPMIYPRYAIRKCSYFRVFQISQDSALYYAQEAVRTADQSRLKTDAGSAYMLMGLLLNKEDYQLAAAYLKKSSQIFYDYGDLAGYSAMMVNLSKIYLENDRTAAALIYNDSALWAGQLALDRGNNGDWLRFYPLHVRANIFRATGQFDSAWNCLNESYELQINSMAKESNEAIVEIEEQYYDEEKKRKIEEQALLLTIGKHRRNRLVLICLGILFFTGALWYSYKKLQKANGKIAEQAIALSKVNTDLSTALDYQLALQGEVHHRVKNNLQTIISLLELQQTEIEDPKAAESLERMSNRIFSIAALHELLYQKEGTEVVNLLDYTERLCAHLGHILEENHTQPVFHIDMKNDPFNLATLMPLGLIINELVTNSMKYATVAGQQLQIAIQLVDQKTHYCIRYRDNGPGYPGEELVEQNGSLGTYLLRSMARQLNGHILTRNEDGAVCELFFQPKNT